MSSRPFLHLLPLALAAAFSCAADEPSSFDEAARKEMLAQFSADEKKLTAEIAQKPAAVPLYSRRGDARMFLARFPEAVADYEKMIALDPAQDAPHWRLGIAYYLTGDFAKSARQFEKYQQHESGDRENGIWHFLANARARNLEQARAAMIQFDRFDREPFPALYDLFAGKKTGAEVFAELEQKKLTKNETVMFFANYYIGLNDQLTGDPKSAREHLQRAVQSGASRERAYMWQIARLQSEALAAGK